MERVGHWRGENTEGRDAKRARPVRRRKERRGRNKGLEESWKKDRQLDGRRAEVTGREHQLSPLGEGPCKAVPQSQNPDPPGSQAWERQKGSK